MTTSIDVFLPHVLPSVIGCPDFSARSAIVEAAIKFCEASHGWTETLDLLYMSNGTHSYELDLPKDTRAVMIKNVWAAKGELIGKNMTEIAANIPDWQTARGTPRFFNQLNWEEMRVYPTPNNPTAAALTVRAALAPKRTASTFPDSFADRNFQAIVSGALWKLLVVPGQAWSNAPLAAYHLGEFNAAVATAKVEMFHDRVQGNARVAPRRFA
ncbi:hypothetical protein [Massilia sp. TSP1-1-2]|uniref:phage adaptor protein n=1 Tax=Massilia sp. TSP1-1-2 TaxID=2804649 RepID=UPI003CEA72FE